MIKIAEFFRTCANALAYRISKLICKFVRFTEKSLARYLTTMKKSKTTLTKKVFETKTLFKEIPNLMLEAKNVRISCVYETHTIRPLFTSFHDLRKLCSFAFKILKVISINRKSSVKQYFKDISTIKNSIYWAVELPKCRKA